MANTQHIRAKILSTVKTQQTTKAMKMVSAARLRRAQHNVLNARPYARRILSLIQKIKQSGQTDHAFLNPAAEVKKILLVVLTSDRGLCGGFNNNIIKYTQQFIQQHKGQFEIDFYFIGRRGSDAFRKRGVEAKKILLSLDRTIRYELASEVADDLQKFFVSGEYQEVRLVYNEFKSAISQNVVDEVLLPIGQKDLAVVEAEPETDVSKEFIFEPSVEKILELLLKKHFAVQVYRCMQESVAAEHGARMAAMENATKNAGEMIRALTLKYNKIRQAAITTELIEITSGAQALEA